MVGDTMPNPDAPMSFDCDSNAPPGPVTIHGVAAGTKVIVNDVNGTHLTTTTVVANGDVQVMVPGCGSVTLAPQVGGAVVVFTYLQPADVIWQSGIHTPVDFSAGPVKLYIDTLVPNTSSYTYSGPISGSANSPTEFNVGASPTDPTTIIVQPNAVVNGVALPRGDLSATLTDVMFSTSGPLHVTSWNASPPPHHFNVTLPSAAVNFGASFGDEIRGHRYFPQYFDVANTTTSVSFDLQIPQVGTGACLSLGMTLGNNAVSLTRVLPSNPPATITVDLPTEMLPQIVDVTRTPATDRPTISWTLAGGAVSPDLTILGIHSDQGKRLIIVLPPGLTSYRLPEFPAAYPLTFNTGQPGLFLYESSDLNGYAASRVDAGQAYFARRYPDGTTVRGTSFGNGF